MSSSLDDDFKPNGRPQSTIARNFSASLHDIFDIDSNLGGLTASVEQKKRVVDSQTRELEAIEARLREAEDRLRERQSRNASPAGRAIDRANGTQSPHRRQPLGETFGTPERNGNIPTQSSPLASPYTQPSQVTSGASSGAGESPYRGFGGSLPGRRKPVTQAQEQAS